MSKLKLRSIVDFVGSSEMIREGNFIFTIVIDENNWDDPRDLESGKSLFWRCDVTGENLMSIELSRFTGKLLTIELAIYSKSLIELPRLPYGVETKLIHGCVRFYTNLWPKSALQTARRPKEEDFIDHAISIQLYQAKSDLFIEVYKGKIDEVVRISNDLEIVFNRQKQLIGLTCIDYFLNRLDNHAEVGKEEGSM